MINLFQTGNDIKLKNKDDLEEKCLFQEFIAAMFELIRSNLSYLTKLYF